ncbi:hypothetical protein LSH36_161g04027, partial [Paralvinella palmiformis]
MPELGFFTFLLINAWLILAYSDSIQNYETVTIDECVPGKYFWRESKP